MAGFIPGAGGGGSRPRAPAADARALAAAARLRRRARPRTHAVRHAAHSRRVLPRDQRGRADRVPHGAQLELHVQRQDLGRVQVQLQPRAVRQAVAHRAAGAASPPRWGCGGSTSAGSGCATPTAEHAALQAVLAALFLVLGLFGGWVHWRRDRQSFWFFGPLMLTLTLLLIYYLNFKYGYSQSPQLGETVDREVRDRDYFYLWSFSAWSVWAALGLVFVWESVRRSDRHRGGEAREAGPRAAAPQELGAVRARARARGSFPCSATGRRRRGTATRPRATSRTTSSTPWSRTASSSRWETTTRSRSGTRRRWRASVATW